jgi:hypothetical protein
MKDFVENYEDRLNALEYASLLDDECLKDFLAELEEMRKEAGKYRIERLNNSVKRISISHKLSYEDISMGGQTFYRTFDHVTGTIEIEFYNVIYKAETSNPSWTEKKNDREQRSEYNNIQ